MKSLDFRPINACVAVRDEGRENPRECKFPPSHRMILTVASERFLRTWTVRPWTKFRGPMFERVKRLPQQTGRRLLDSESETESFCFPPSHLCPWSAEQTSKVGNLLALFHLLPLLPDQTPRVLAEFLEVAITSIVFLKGIYPPGAFERRRYMSVVVQRARHPQLRDYIHSAVTGLQPFIQKIDPLRYLGWFFLCKDDPQNMIIINVGLNDKKEGKVVVFHQVQDRMGLVERVTVIFYNKDRIPAERFVFKLALNELYGSKVEEQDLEFALRSFLVKLSAAEPDTKTLPQGSPSLDPNRHKAVAAASPDHTHKIHEQRAIVSPTVHRAPYSFRTHYSCQYHQ
ncbi:hypothetical protein ACLOJK_020036 [Asimina triloba]